MVKRHSNHVPQVLTIVQPTQDYVINLVKKVRDYLGLHGDKIYLTDGQEICLSAKWTHSGRPIVLHKNRFQLMEWAIKRLGLEPGDSLALIERDGSLALKTLTVQETPGEWAQAFDQETDLHLVRYVLTNPEADELLSQLLERNRTVQLKADLLDFLHDREGFAAWHARRILGCPDPQDADRAKMLIQARLEIQLADGSWEADVLATATTLQEIFFLGLPASDPVIQRGANWLIDRAWSTYNPGMFFLTDVLVEQQEAIVRSREQGNGGRFRQRKSSEINRVRNSIPTANDPCGPRIMWPTALVVAVLVRLGYEPHPRLQAAFKMLLHGGWCECGYQHGIHGWRDLSPMTERNAFEFDQSGKQAFRYGGLSGVEELGRLDGHDLPRVACQPTQDCVTYPLRLPEHLQPCELITTLGLSQVEDPLLRTLATAHLWYFASRQHPPNGDFAGEGQRHVTPYFFLDLFSRFDHPAAHIALLRSLPWVVGTQNPDGSWGQGKLQEAATLAVARMLAALQHAYPSTINLIG